MTPRTRRERIAGPAGAIECAIDEPADMPRGLAVICHPHPQAGGTLDNKVVQTLARAFAQLGLRSVRFNFRGIGASEGAWDGGRGEVDDALAVIGAYRTAPRPRRRARCRWCSRASPSAAMSRPRRRGACPRAPRRRGWCSSRRRRRRSRCRPCRRTRSSFTVMPTTSCRSPPRSMGAATIAACHVVPGAGHFFHGRLTLLKDIVLRASALNPGRGPRPLLTFLDSR